MLGWEFPPFISGGLGTACYGLTKAMSQLGLKITFCLPKIVEGQYAEHVNLLSPDSLTPTAATRIDELTNVTFPYDQLTIAAVFNTQYLPAAYRRNFEAKTANTQSL